MTSFPPPMCLSCARLDVSKPGMYCTAFPEGIPVEITESRFDHRTTMTGEPTFVQHPGRPEPDWEVIA